MEGGYLLGCRARPYNRDYDIQSRKSLGSGLKRFKYEFCPLGKALRTRLEVNELFDCEDQIIADRNGLESFWRHMVHVCTGPAGSTRRRARGDEEEAFASTSPCEGPCFPGRGAQ